MEHVESSAGSVIGHAEVTILYSAVHGKSYSVPIVEEYEDEHQSDLNEVFTMDDLCSEVASALELGQDGSLCLPVTNARLDANGEQLDGYVWINVGNVLSIEVLAPNA